MIIGLDLGSHRFRSIRHDSKKLIARSCPAVFATLADTPPHRRLLHQSGTRFATCADHLLLAGDAANEWSAMLNLPLFPLLKGGRVPTSDVIARQILTLMIDAMLPVPESPGGHCCLTIPGGQADGFVEQRDADFFQQLGQLTRRHSEIFANLFQRDTACEQAKDATLLCQHAPLFNSRFSVATCDDNLCGLTVWGDICGQFRNGGRH